jgi:hypothetical protein
MHTESLTCQADGLTMESHLYLHPAKRGKSPGVLHGFSTLAHDAVGPSTPTRPVGWVSAIGA